MKIKLSLAILLFVFIAKAQTYHFDYYISYDFETSEDGEVSKTTYNKFINSKIEDYQMRVINGTKTKLGVSMTDFSNLITHYFDLKNSDFPIKNEDFVYLYSVNHRKFGTHSVENKRNYVTKLVQKDNDVFLYNIVELKSKVLEAKFGEVTAKFQQFDANLGAVGLEVLFDDSLIRKKVQFNENLILTSAQRVEKDKTLKMNFAAVEDVNIELNIPPDQIKYLKNH
ncbi:hypothetical protein [Chryseobacterium sp.]|uniref:hypothetical protein n=1 Tax=Chryseobacterium sp. TaxID=1871047 RepID=UPI0028A2B52F|nr:hypothetical protein [Chryseobacterium sp.]